MTLSLLRQSIVVLVTFMRYVSALFSLARRAVLELCHGECLILLRNVPGQREATNNPTAITFVGRSIFSPAK